MTGRRILLLCFLTFFVLIQSFAAGSTTNTASTPVLAGHAGAPPSAKHKKDRIAEEQNGRPVLWKNPGAIEHLNLARGIGGAKDAPDLSGRFTFVERDKKGSQKKIIVKDDKGVEWTVKYGAEARPETASTRIVWAMGYHTDVDYFVPRVHIEGLKDDAVNVRFKRRHDGYKNIGNWSWDDNPFVGTRELDGLKVLMVLLDNWDLKTSNNKILVAHKKHASGPATEIYYVGDLGATFGKIAPFSGTKYGLPILPGTKDKPDQYARESFVKNVRYGAVNFHYRGKDRATIKGIPAEHVRWIGHMLARLSNKQLADAFRASGYNEEEIVVLVHAMRQRINELQNLQNFQ